MKGHFIVFSDEMGEKSAVLYESFKQMQTAWKRLLHTGQLFVSLTPHAPMLKSIRPVSAQMIGVYDKYNVTPHLAEKRADEPQKQAIEQ